MSDNNPKGPMHGVRVIDVATFIAAPYTASILGEFGAEVIKVEQPGKGDLFRHFGTPTDAEGMSLAWLSEARNKKSVTLNLRVEAGAELFRQLVAQSDVVCENFRPGTMEKWGLGWEDLRAINPGLIMLRVSGYGQTGPYKDRPGFARIAHAFGGLTHLAGNPGETPVTPGSTSLADYMSGLYGAIGVLIALRHRDATGEGQMVDVALYESVFRALDEIAPRFQKHDFVREPEGSGTINACPHGHFRCSDGAYVALACTTDRMFERLCLAMDRPDLLSAYGIQAVRLASREDVNKQVETWVAAQSRDEVMKQCVSFEVPIGPVNTIEDIFNDPHIKSRQNLTTVDGLTIPSVLPRLSETPGTIDHLGPALGNANKEILQDLLGLSEDELNQLITKAIV